MLSKKWIHLLDEKKLNIGCSVTMQKLIERCELVMNGRQVLKKSVSGLAIFSKINLSWVQ